VAVADINPADGTNSIFTITGYIAPGKTTIYDLHIDPADGERFYLVGNN